MIGHLAANDGTGGHDNDGSGHGLAGMTERAVAVGGKLSAGPRPGGGFEVTARLPMPAAQSAPAP